LPGQPDVTGVHVVEANDVEAQLRQAAGDLRGIFLFRKSAGKCEIGPEKTDAAAVFIHKMTALDRNAAGSPAIQIRHIHGRVFRGAHG